MSVVAGFRVRYSSGAVESLKLLAFLSMLIDHVNKAFFASELSWAVPLGRLAMPIFAALIAYNMARPGADHAKALRRLLFFGLLAVPFFPVVNSGHWWPQNVMFTFAVAVTAIAFIDRGQGGAATLVLLLGGAFVDYFWAGPLLTVAAYFFFRRPSMSSAAGVLLALAGLCAVAGNPWAFLAVVPLTAATQLHATVPRLRWLFWIGYPAHLALLWLLQQTLPTLA